MKLGEGFTFGARLESVQRQFRAGLVITLFCDFVNDPKPKWLLIVCARCDPPLFFIVNTDPTEYAQQTPRLRNQQVPILKVDDPFMDHDSWIDCSVVFNNFDLAGMIDALANDVDRVKGVICKDTALAILEKVTESEVLEHRHINQISAELSQLI
jgi:hypothetical protein